MAQAAHLQSLARRHHELETALADELKHPGIDELRTYELKRKKLRIKDKMAALEREENRRC